MLKLIVGVIGVIIILGNSSALSETVPDQPRFEPNQRDIMLILDDTLGSAEDTLGWDNIYCSIALEKVIELFGELAVFYQPGSKNRAFIDDSINDLSGIKTYLDENITKAEGINPISAEADSERKKIRDIRKQVRSLLSEPTLIEPGTAETGSEDLFSEYVITERNKKLQGLIHFAPPTVMRVGDPELVTAKIIEGLTETAKDIILEGVPEESRDKVTGILVEKEMHCELRGPNFDIESCEKESTRVINGEDASIWQWWVTPKEPGKQKLSLHVFYDFEKEPAREAYVYDVTVKVGGLRAWWEGNGDWVKWVFGAVIAVIGLLSSIGIIKARKKKGKNDNGAD